MDRDDKGDYVAVDKYGNIKQKLDNDSSWDFVILREDPHRIRIGTVLEGGHSAIAEGKPILYAGMATFKDPKNAEWKNWSGHYTPTDLASHQTMFAVNHKRNIKILMISVPNDLKIYRS